MLSKMGLAAGAVHFAVTVNTPLVVPIGLASGLPFLSSCHVHVPAASGEKTAR